MIIAGSILLAIALGGHPQSGQEVAQSARPRQPQPPPAVSAIDAAELRAALRDLTDQVRRLREELSRQRSFDMTRFNANTARLNLVLADLDRLKKDRDLIRDKIRSAQARQYDAELRLSNIQLELVNSNVLNRSDAETRLRTDLNQRLRQAQDELVDLERELDRIQQRIEAGERIADTLRRRLKIDDSQVADDEDDEPSPSVPRRARQRAAESGENEPPPEDADQTPPPER
jgi:DNA repair exonuclease SbcCD ATPase subunit